MKRGFQAARIIMKRVGLMFLLAGAMFAQNGKNAPTGSVFPADPDSTIRVEVFRVPLLFTVTDQKNHFITDLDREDFRVFDKGKRQVIKEFVRESELPLRIGILLDTSNSIRNRFKFEKEAAIEFVRTVLQEEKDKAFLVSFDTRAELIVDFTNDADELARGIRSTRSGGGTALFEAIYYACRDKLPEDWPPEQFRRALVVLGDGEDNQSSVTREMALEMAQKAETVIYAISTNRSGKFFPRRQGAQEIHARNGGHQVSPFPSPRHGTVFRRYCQRASSPVFHSVFAEQL